MKGGAVGDRPRGTVVKGLFARCCWRARENYAAMQVKNMTYCGWKLPTRPITNKILVYTRTETRYYIYIDGNGHVEYVYRSSS